jgi:hypothetical protein
MANLPLHVLFSTATQAGLEELYHTPQVFSQYSDLSYFRPGKAGSYKQPLIQQIAHATFDPLGVKQRFPCDSSMRSAREGLYKSWQCFRRMCAFSLFKNKGILYRIFLASI